MFPGEIARVVYVGLLATVVVGALLIAAVVPTGKGGMSEKE